MRGVPGTTCELRCNHWDGGDPTDVDFLRTDAGSCYLVDEFVPSRPGSASLGVFRCTRLERDAVSFADPGVAHWSFWSR